MHAILSQISGLVGLFVFLARVWRLAPIEDAVFTGMGAALAVYIALMLGDLVIRRIIIQNLPDTSTEPVHTSHQQQANAPRSSDEHTHAEEPALANAAV